VISAGLARLVGTDPALIVEGSKELLRRSPEDRARARRANPFGDGKAAERIAALVEEFLLARGGGSAV
jgi:UDP-N-acetylglucosamine 2-epimerase (non-hydrolysing)